MAQYIDKSALVAEINRLKDCCYKICAWNLDFLKNTYPEHYYSIKTYDKILSFTDTLEVKEVDLEKAARKYLLHEHLSPLNNILHQADLKTELQYHKDIETAFKAGFELGLKAQKGK